MIEPIAELRAERDAAYRAACDADKRWHDAIVAQYGEKLASDYRYGERGVATPELADLWQQYRDARDCQIGAQDRYLKALHWGQA
jgi:hypothetical protein